MEIMRRPLGRDEPVCRASLHSDLVRASLLSNIDQASGGMAQLVARLHGMEKVRGSNPLTSTARRALVDDQGPSLICGGVIVIAVTALTCPGGR